MSSTTRKKKSKRKSEDADDVDIYHNLPEFEEYDTKLEKLRVSNENLMSKLKELESNVETLTKTNHKLSKMERALSRNISVLFTTALAELQHKDQMIADLRRERDSLIFRRYQRTDQCSETAVHTGVIVQEVVAQPQEVQSVSTEVFSNLSIPCREKPYKLRQDTCDSKSRHSKNNTTFRPESEKYNYKKNENRNFAPSMKPSKIDKIQCNNTPEENAKTSYQNTNQGIESNGKTLEKTNKILTDNEGVVNSHPNISQVVSLYNAVKKSGIASNEFRNSKDSLFRQEERVTNIPDASPSSEFLTDRVNKDTEDIIKNISQKSFRIPKLKHGDKEVSIVNSSVLSIPNDMKDASQGTRYRIKPPEDYDDDKKSIDNAIPEKLNTSVEASLSSSTECVFSMRRKSRIKILNVSREDDTEEAAVVKKTSTKRTCSIDLNESDPPKKVPHLGLKEQESQSISENLKDDVSKPPSNLGHCDKSEQKNSLKLHVDHKEKNNSKLEEEKMKSDSSKQSRRSENKFVDHRHTSREEDKLNRRRNIDGSLGCSKKSRDAARQGWGNYDSRRSSRDYRQRSRSFSSDGEYSDYARSSKSRRNSRYKANSNYKQIKLSPSLERNKTLNYRKHAVVNDMKTSESPDLDLEKESDGLKNENSDVNTPRSSNIMQSSGSESPDDDSYLKTYLSDDYFSGDQESSIKSAKKSARNENCTILSRRRSRSVSSSDDKHYRERRSYKSRNVERRASPSRKKVDRRFDKESRSHRNHQMSRIDLREKLKKSRDRGSEAHEHEHSSVMSNKDSKQVMSSQISSSIDKISDKFDNSKHSLSFQSCKDLPSSVNLDITSIVFRKPRKQILNLQFTSTTEESELNEDKPNDSSKSVDKQNCSKVNSDLEDGEISD